MEAKKVIQIEKYLKHTKNKPKKRLKKKIRSFFFSLFIILIVGSVFYFTSPMSKLSMIYFNGLNYVSRSQLIEMTGLSYQDYFWSLDTKKIAESIAKHPLVLDVKVKRDGLNRLAIDVKEKDVLGCAEIDKELRYILSDGKLIENTQSEPVVCQGTVLYGLPEDSEAVLSLFIQSMTKLDSIFINLIKEIHYEPKYGDENRFSLFLKDGNTVNVNSYSMERKLKYYQTMVEQVNSLYEGVKGTYHLDVGDYFEPYEGNEKVIIDSENLLQQKEE